LQVAPQTYYAAKSRPPSKRSITDKVTLERIRRVHKDNFSVYGAKKLHAELVRRGHRVARCTVERLMRTDGLHGVRRSAPAAPRTTVPGAGPDPRADLVDRQFTAAAPAGTPSTTPSTAPPPTCW
jgi:putative transposase